MKYQRLTCFIKYAPLGCDYNPPMPLWRLFSAEVAEFRDELVLVFNGKYLGPIANKMQLKIKTGDCISLYHATPVTYVTR